MIDTIISLIGLGYQHFSGIKHDKTLDKFFNEFKRLNNNFEKITEHIFYFKNETVNYSSDKQKFVSNLRDVREILEPVQKMTGNKIISNAILVTPEAMQKSFRKNPHQVLDLIQPFDLAKPHPNKEMIPILFEENKMYYIGWQMKGLIPLLFNFDFNDKSVLFSNTIDEKQYILDENIGLEIQGGKFSIMLKKGSELPIHYSQNYSTADDNQTSIELNIFASDMPNDTLIYQNYPSFRKIGSYRYDKIPSVPKGLPRIEISFSIDIKSLLIVSSKDFFTNEYISNRYSGIKTIVENILKLRFDCPSCSKKMRTLRNKHIKVKCPDCSCIIEIKNNAIINFQKNGIWNNF